ncbi:MAG: CRISPR-associated endonuclease Cas1 [Acidimicrobiales bacterium]
MVPLHVLDPAAVLTRRAGRIEVRSDGKLLASAPLTQLSSVVIEGRAGISTPAIHALLYHDIPVVFLSSRGRAIGRLEAPGSGQVTLRQRQLRRSLQVDFCLQTSRSIVAGKIHNQRMLLAGRARRSPRGHGGDISPSLSALSRLEGAVAGVTTVASAVGVEGAASSGYFRTLRQLIPGSVHFQSRSRGAPDVFNALVNYCSALLRETVLTFIFSCGLDPCISFMHIPMRGRPTLAFDLMEEWRPVLVEGTSLALLGLGAVNEDDVAATPDGPRLTESARRHAVRRFFQRLGPGEGTSLRMKLRSQVSSFAWVVDGHAPGNYQPFRWR